MSRGDSARTHYESARQELIQRIRLRDNVLLFYLGAVGTIAGVALGSSDPRWEILLVLPFLALGAATLVSQHNALIGSLGHFCVEEIEPFLEDLPNSERAPQWDSSRALEEYKDQAVALRSWGHTVLVLAPGFGSLAVNYRYSVTSFLPYGILWWLGLVSTAIATLIIYRTYRWRTDRYERTFEQRSRS